MILVADNINPMNPVVADAMQRLDSGPVKDIARRCEQAGAKLLDINPGHLSARRRDRMRFLVDAAQEACGLRLIIDSPDPEILADGLAACAQTPVLSALTLEENKLAEIPQLAAESGADLVLLLLDSRSECPRTEEEKIGLALELHAAAISAGILHEHIIFDPVLPSMSWTDPYEYLAATAVAVKLLSTGAVLGEQARTMCGLSNLLSGGVKGFPDTLPETCLGVLAGAGLDVALANVLRPSIISAYDMVARMAVKCF